MENINNTKQKRCRFFNTRKGCRAGDACQFLHVPKTSGSPNEVDTALTNLVKKDQMPKAVPIAESKNEARMKTPQSRPPLLAAALTQDPRSREIQQLERRFRAQGFEKTDDKVKGTLLRLNIRPTDPNFPFDLDPKGLRCQFLVNLDYPKGSITEFEVRNPEIPQALKEQLQHSFVKEQALKRLSLLQWMNWIDRNMEVLLTPPKEVVQKTKEGNELVRNQSGTAITFVHTRQLPKPQQMTLEEPFASLDLDEKNESINEFREVLDEASSQPTVQTVDPEEQKPNRPAGIEIRLTSVEMQAIALGKCTLLSVLAKCSRCQFANELLNLRPHPEHRLLPCHHCQQQLFISYRPEWVHTHAKTLGYVQTGNLILVDLLPSTFEWTCDACSAEDPPIPPFLVKRLGRSDKITHRCQHCHASMSMCIEDVRFRQLGPPSGTHSKLSTTAQSSSNRSRKQRQKEEGFIAGQPLSKQGACEHYTKSYRYLRFPCW